MLMTTTIFLNPEHKEQLAVLGAPRGLKSAAMTRIAIAEYLERHPLTPAQVKLAARRVRGALQLEE
jgi:hypothetical protein